MLPGIASPHLAGCQPKLSPYAITACHHIRELGEGDVPRQVLHAAIGRHHRSFDFRAAALGKANTVLQFATVTAVLFHHPTVWPLAGACSAVGFAAAVQYLLRAWCTLREPPPG